jgi:hypothetical protein
MASKLARRKFGGVTVRRPSPLIGKLREKLANASKRARSAGGSKMTRDLMVLGGGIGLGYAEQKNVVPARIGPIDSALVIGGLGAFVAPRFLGGRIGSAVHDVTLGVCTVGAYRLGTGQPVMGDGGWGP